MSFCDFCCFLVFCIFLKNFKKKKFFVFFNIFASLFLIVLFLKNTFQIFLKFFHFKKFFVVFFFFFSVFCFLRTSDSTTPQNHHRIRSPCTRHHARTKKRAHTSWRSDVPIILPGWERYTGGSWSKPTVHLCLACQGGCGLLTEQSPQSTTTTTNEPNNTSHETMKSRMVAERKLQTHVRQEPDPHPEVVSGVRKLSAPQSRCGRECYVLRGAS